MDMTPEDIAKLRHHHDIVELLTDWSLGCNSPKAVPAPTSPHEGQKSPLANMASPPATSPPTVEIHGGGGPAIMQHFSAARPKTNAMNRSQGPSRPRPATGSSNNNNTKRKRKKTRPDEEQYPVISTVPSLSPTATLSPRANNVTAVSSCATGQTFSPNCMQIANGLSPLGSAGISPADSTTLSPLQPPDSLEQQPPSPLEILSPEDLAGLEDVGIDCLDELDFDTLSPPTDMPIDFPPTTTIGHLGLNDHIVPTTSDCMYIPNAPPVRRSDPLEGQRLYSVHSTPDLHCGGLQHHDSRPIVFNGRTCHSAQKASIATPSLLASYQAITNSNMYPSSGGGVMPLRKDFHNNDYMMQQPLQLQNQLVMGHIPIAAFDNRYECVSPQKIVSFPTPSPDSPGQWSSSSSSSSC